MRRKSTRNTKKSPEKVAKEVESPKVRRSRRRKRTPSETSGGSDDEVLSKRFNIEETPDTTTKSHSPSDEDTSQERMWKITQTEEPSQGGIKKLKICITRPASESPDKTKTRRSKSGSHTEDDATNSSEDKVITRRKRSSPINRRDDTDTSKADDEELEDNRGKGKSKGKHKSKIEKSPHIIENENLQTSNEISENVQVTPQSPTIVIPVDNENDFVKVDADNTQKICQPIDNQEDNNQSNETTILPEPSKSSIQEEQIEMNIPQSNEDQIKDNSSNLNHQSEIKNNEEINNEIVENINNDKLNVISSVTGDNIEHESKTEEQKTPEIPKLNIDNNNDDNKEKIENNDDNNKKNDNKNIENIDDDKNNENTEEKTNENIDDKIDKNIDETEDKNINEKDDKNIDEKEDKKDETIIEENLQQLEPETINNNKTTSIIVVEEKIQNENDIISVEIKSDTETINNCEIKDTNNSDNDKNEEKPREEENILSHLPNDQVEKSPNKKKLRRNFDYNNHENLTYKIMSKKEKWENSLNKVPCPNIKIDLDIIKTVYPFIEFPQEPDLSLDIKDRRKLINDTKKFEKNILNDNNNEYENSDNIIKYNEEQNVQNNRTDDNNLNIIAFNRKISIVDDTASKLKPPPSPAKNPISNILFITNLVRPFTLKQLKELLERTGKINEENFWTDKIKSKCYVQYEMAEEAEATRNALHKVQWPIGNGKNLLIEYATIEDLENARNPPPPIPPTITSIPPTQSSTSSSSHLPEKETKITDKENIDTVKTPFVNEERVVVEGVKRNDSIREWDLGKKDNRRERSRSHDRMRKYKRSPTPRDDYPKKKLKKIDDSPQKLMDDLFLKTKTSPSIYWQPLSPEEIQTKQQQRLIRMEEHKRRLEENSRIRGREVGRAPSFRRRYD